MNGKMYKDCRKAEKLRAYREDSVVVSATYACDAAPEAVKPEGQNLGSVTSHRITDGADHLTTLPLQVL